MNGMTHTLMIAGGALVAFIVGYILHNVINAKRLKEDKEIAGRMDEEA